MTAFGLDDVREAYTSDVTRFLAEIETNATLMMSAATLAIPAEATWRLPVAAVVGGLHGIVGSSSLIALDPMTVTARRLEGIAGTADESIRLLKWHATRLHRIAAMCLDGAGELRAILEHDLAGLTGDAQRRGDALNARLDAMLATLAAGPQPDAVLAEPARGVTPAAAPPRFKIPAVPRRTPATPPDEGWTDRAVGEPAAPGDELAETFLEEARATLTSLGGYHARLAQRPDDDDAVTQCLRLLHLLKGAAGLTGRGDVASAAGALHGWLELVQRQGITAGAVEQLGHRIDQLAAQAVGARPAPAPAPAMTELEPSAAPDGDEPREMFLDEARGALDELAALVRQVQAATGTARGVAASRIERVLHRLRGSALIVGEPRLAELAARGQQLCEALDRVEPAALAIVVDELAALVRPAAPDREPTLHPFVRPAAEEWDAYTEESSALLDDLDRVLVKLEQATRPADELSTMFRMYHTLKGASSSVGLAPIARQLHLIETFLETIVAGHALPELRPVVTVLASEHAAMRANIARAAVQDRLEVDHARLAARLAAAVEGGSQAGSSWIAASDPVWSMSVGDPGDDHDGAAASRSQVSQVSQAPHTSRDASEHAPQALLGSDKPADPGRRFIRVAADRLDGLLDLVGELVVARSRMLTRIGKMHRLQGEDQHRHGTVIRLVDEFATSTQFANLDGRRGRSGGRPGGARVVASPGFGALELDHYEEIHVLSRQLDEAASDVNEMRRELTTEMLQLTEDAETLSAIVTGLQTEITQARMLTIETLFTRLRLPVRDAAHRLGREVEIVTRGEHVAIDKAISDALFGPLLHVVRNAVVHGIEGPDRRAAAGKPRAGTLSLSARQDQGQLVLELADDGQGIDVARLKAIGVDKGLIDPATPDGDPRVLELVFVHGLSTSDVAGRGVGGNVVRRAVDRLNGTIAIETKRGSGTTFRISLPLSMSITQAVVMRTAGVTLAIPIAFAETILPRDGVELIDTFGRTRVQIGGAMMPVHLTRRLLGEAAQTTGGVLIVCVVGAERIAIQVDEVVGQEEIVIKSLGNLLEGHPLFSGSTQRGDGELVLILDVPGLLAAETAELRGAAAFEVEAVEGPAGTSRSEAPSRSDSVAASAASTGSPAASPPAAVEPQAAPHRIAIAELAPLPVDRLRVLFVDDSLSVRKVAERMLVSLGVEVVTAVDGQDALDKLRALEFSLVFTDLEMPRVHGFELIREMQYVPAYSAIPVVVISSRSGQKHIDQALGLGAREYLTKPFSPEVLGAVLARLVKRDPAVS
jgi:chemosensory pili system protein ChpA (sensor histidine kinase/response regulator)